METPQVAQVEGTVLYRHTFMGETKFAEEGDTLPLVPERPGKWEPWVGDNVESDENSLTVLVDTGIIHAIIMLEWPEEGMKINIKGSKIRPYDGLYVVTEVGTMKWGDEEFVHIHVERVDDIDETKLIHLPQPLNC